MRIGMLWVDSSKASPEEKILRAVEYYQSKYGVTPTVCMVHPSLQDGLERVGELQVKANKHVRPNHFWIGVGGANE